jgi:hypothetical protein
MRLEVYHFPLMAFVIGVLGSIPMLSDNSLPIEATLSLWAICIGSVLCYATVLTSVHEDIATDGWTRASFSFWLIGVIALALILPFIYLIVTIVYGIGVGKAISESLTYDDVLNNKKGITCMNAVASVTLAVMAYFV